MHLVYLPKFYISPRYYSRPMDLDQEGLDTSSAEETETGATEDLRLQPDNLGASSEMTIGGPRNEPDGPPVK